MDSIADLLHEALIVTSLLSFPVLIVATVVGTVVSIFQAATQIQESTLSALPKIFAVMLLVAMFGPAGMLLCAHLLTDAVASIKHLVAS